VNRLWVRTSLVIGVLVVLIAVLPFLVRPAPPRPEVHDQPPTPGLTDRQASEIQTIVANREYRLWMSIFRTVVIGVVLGSLAGVVLSRWLTAPLSQLEKGARAVSQGRLDYRVPVKGSQEMQSVAIAFNHMAEDLEGAETLRRNLLADVTHELRHPVHILQGNLKAILDGIYPLEMVEVAGLLDQTQQLISLVDELHEMAQAESHQLMMDRQPTDLAELAARVIESFQPLAASREVRLEMSAVDGPQVREVDADRIRQVLQNLLNNALRYTPAGGQVTVSVASVDPWVELRVADNGAGIAPEHLAHIFDRFYTADPSRNRDYTGSGLGLAIAKAIVEAHGGQIEAHSPGKDQGTMFIIRL